MLVLLMAASAIEDVAVELFKINGKRVIMV